MANKILFVVIILVAIANILSATPADEKLHFIEEKHSTTNEFAVPTSQEQSHLLRTGRFLASKAMRCDKQPSVCRAKSSDGPNCCKKQCVNLMKDRLNCGKCGNKCKYSEICCHGKCVNPSVDEMHCGKCNHRCMKGRKCVYGLCNYA